jgi:hypothetical protein
VRQSGADGADAEGEPPTPLARTGGSLNKVPHLPQARGRYQHPERGGRASLPGVIARDALLSLLLGWLAAAPAAPRNPPAARCTHEADRFVR